MFPSVLRIVPSDPVNLKINVNLANQYSHNHRFTSSAKGIVDTEPSAGKKCCSSAVLVDLILYYYTRISQYRTMQ